LEDLIKLEGRSIGARVYEIREVKLVEKDEKNKK
tara:strand:+ start:31 stop:132 length:102 start_codon:yes stop_codon:yes gene_type:complete